MNPKKILILMTVLIFAVLMNAQFASFRSMSTAGILDGEIEYILVPGELAYVDGFNVYTNLSNFNYGSEALIGGFSDNYLIGTKFDYMGMHSGILHQSDDYSFAWKDVDVENYFEDTSGDNAYDYHINDSIDDNTNYAEHEDVTYYGFSYGAKDEMRFGFGYTRDNWSQHEFGDQTEIITSDDLVTGDPLSYRFDNLMQNEVDAYITQTFELSMYYPMEMMDIGFNAYYGPSMDKDQYKELDTTYIDRAPAGGITNYELLSMTVIQDYQRSRINWGTGVTVKRNCEDYMGEFIIGYDNITLGRTDMFSTDSFSYFEEVAPVAWGNDTMMVYDTVTSMDTLSYIEESRNSMNAGMKYVRKLDKALFGLGVYFSMDNFSGSSVRVYDEENIEYYNDGDGVDDAADYTTTITSSYTRNYNSNYVNHHFRLPVGVEFNANESLVFRLGANTQFSWYNTEYYTRVTQWEPAMQVTTDGTGATTETLLENPGTRDEYQFELHSFSKYTTYSYGLGWKISDNFSIDLMGFANLTDMSGWEISANAKF